MQTVRFLNRNNATIVVAGHSYLSVWDYDRPNNKLRSTEIQLGQLRRVFASVHIDADDAYVYAATASGDIFQVCLLCLDYVERSSIGRSGKTRIDNVESIEETHSRRRDVRFRHERWSDLCRVRRRKCEALDRFASHHEEQQKCSIASRGVVCASPQWHLVDKRRRVVHNLRKRRRIDDGPSHRHTA